MTVTADNFADYQIDLQLEGGGAITFFAFNGRPLEEATEKIAAMRPIFERIPAQHRRAIGPIYLLIERPWPAMSGGGTTPSVHNMRARREHVREARAEAWGATWEALEAAADAHDAINTDLVHFIPLDRWQRTRGYKTTVIHECVHGIDNAFHLTRRASETRERAGFFRAEDFPASLPRQACAHGTALNRQAVNAYVSMVFGFPGVRRSLRDQIIETFRTSSAFFAVPEEDWNRLLRDEATTE